jgi:APA family basic amino acid/polyamine antiporter
MRGRAGSLGVVRRRQQVSLGRVIGAGGLFGMAYGYVGTSVYFVLGAIALYALGTAPFLILCVGVIFVATAWSYAEASAALPDASGVASFVRRAFDPMSGFAAAWALLLDCVIMVALASSFAASYLGAIWPRLQDRPYATLAALLVVALLVALNALGLRESARLSTLLAVLGLATLVLLLIVGFFKLLQPGQLREQIQLGTAPTWRSLLYAAPIAAAAFTGLDAASSRAESALDPGHDVPRAINVVLPLVVIVSVGLSLVGLSAMPVGSNVVPVDQQTGLTQPVTVVPGDEEGTYVVAGDPSVPVVVPVAPDGTGYVIPAQEPTGPVIIAGGQATTRLYGTLLGSAYLQEPVTGIVVSLPDEVGWLRDILLPWVAVVVALALVLVANAVLGGSARIVYSLARHHQVPPLLGRVQAARMTPYVAVVVLGLAAAVVLIPGDPSLVLGLFGFGSTLAFIMAHLSVIRLRYREPTLGRPFVVPFNLRVRRALLPLPAILGAGATAVIWVLMVATHPAGRLVGFAWMAAGLALYALYRRRVARPLLRQPTETKLPSAAVSDVDYERVLVPVDGTRLSDEMMVLGCQLASDKGATIDAVYAIEVPMHLPLDAPLTEERARGRKVLDGAMAVAAEFGVEAWPHLVAARRSGRAIVETAQEWDCDVIVMGAAKSPLAEDSLFSDSVTYVLRHAPGEVLLNLVPPDYPMRGSAVEFDEEGAAAVEEGGTQPGGDGDLPSGRDDSPLAVREAGQRATPEADLPADIGRE